MKKTKNPNHDDNYEDSVTNNNVGTSSSPSLPPSPLLLCQDQNLVSTFPEHQEQRQQEDEPEEEFMSAESTNRIHHNATHDHKNDDSSSSSSSEAAGIARGAARTASTMSRRSLVGRLPKSAHVGTGTSVPAATRMSPATATSTTAATTANATVAASRGGRMLGKIPNKVPRKVPSSTIPRKVPVKQVAKVSDRMSAGLDIYDAAITSSTAGGGSNDSSSNNSSRVTLTTGGSGHATNNSTCTRSNNRGSSCENDAKRSSNSHVNSQSVAKASSSSSSRMHVQEQEQAVVQKWKSVVRNVFSFANTMVKNTIMGTAVFAGYEKTIQYWDEYNLRQEASPPPLPPPSSQQQPQLQPQLVVMDMETMKPDMGSTSTSASTAATATAAAAYPLTTVGTDAYQRTWVSQHFMAGFLAGSIHSIFHMSFQSVGFLQQHWHRWNAFPQHIPTFHQLSSWTIRHTLHHGLAHALLFSTYEGSKRYLMGGDNSRILQSQMQNHGHTAVVHDTYEWNDDESGHDHEEENTVCNVFLIGLAGGFAGQVQHVISHYTETCLCVTENDSPKTHGQTKVVFPRANLKFWRLSGPSIRSVVMAFPPSAIGFVAFEFGKMLMDG